MEINWFPGHMAKALRNIKQNLAKVDMVIETCDARIPRASRNPELDNIIDNKPRILVLNKADLADDNITGMWIENLSSNNLIVIAVDGTKVNDAKFIREKCISVCSGKIERAKAKGRLIRPIRAMVVGIPNTGKSTIINTLSKKKVAATSDRPGVTRSPQWVRAGEDLELMDMPGVLWPKIEDRNDQVLLAGTGAIRDTVLDMVEVAYKMMIIMSDICPEKIMERYKIDLSEVQGYDAFELAAKKRGCILSGGRIDEERFAALFLDELRAGLMGKISFEKP